MTEHDKALSEPPAALAWPDPSPPTKGVNHYDHIKAHGFTIEWKSWKERPAYCVMRDQVNEQFLGSFDTLDEAKAAIQAALSEPPAALAGDEARAIIRGFMACSELDIDARDKDPETLALETRALRFLNAPPAALASDAIEAAAKAYAENVQLRGPNLAAMEKAIAAYLAALPKPAALAEIEGLVRQLRGRAKFLAEAKQRVKSPGLMYEAATALENLSARVGELERGFDRRGAKIIEMTEAHLARVAQLEAALRLIAELKRNSDKARYKGLWRTSSEIALAALSTEAKAQGGERSATLPPERFCRPTKVLT